MKEIWINPVTAAMYEPKKLDEFLQKHGYRQYISTKDWAETVRRKYKAAVNNTSDTVIDIRCPKINELLDAYGMRSKEGIFVPDIHPILIHYAKEASIKAYTEQKEILITTPCQALADMGNNMQLSGVRFISWSCLVMELGEEPARKQLNDSPIPPGFFNSLNSKTVSISGDEEISEYFTHFIPGEASLAELLYCKNGCHNGDGIRPLYER